MEERLRRCRSSWDLNQCGVYEGSVYRSQWWRGLGRQMEWLRLTLEGTELFHTAVYVCDDPPEEFGPPGGAPALRRDANDLLLYGVRGRYLTFTVEPGEKLTGFTLTFPGRSIVEGLPAVMQGDDTLRALLGVYQSRYMDLNQAMRAFPDRLDPVSPEALPQLPQWLGASRWAMDSQGARAVLPWAAQLARMRGTRQGLLLLARLVTGYSCRVVESWKLERMGQSTKEQEGIRTICGVEREKVAILVPAQVSQADAERFRALLPDFVPLGVPYRMVHLEDGAPMDGYSYLDDNGVLTEERVSQMDDTEADDVILE